MLEKLGDGEKNKIILVIDASVIVKWFVEEEYSREARFLKTTYVEGLIDIAVPSILYYEVLNALKYSGGFGEEELKDIARILENFQLNTYELNGEYALKTIEYAMRKGVTVYDASYVALADLLNTILYTADYKLINKINNPNLVKHISLFKI